MTKYRLETYFGRTTDEVWCHVRALRASTDEPENSGKLELVEQLEVVHTLNFSKRSPRLRQISDTATMKVPPELKPDRSRTLNSWLRQTWSSGRRDKRFP